jgi:C-terminal processing protease CtpA/Prc
MTRQLMPGIVVQRILTCCVAAALSLFVTASSRGEDGLTGGIGVVLTATDGGKIVSVLPGGPAAKEGLRAGDTIASIDGQATANMSFSNTVGLLRGEPGTPVRLAVEKYMGGVELEMTLIRQPIGDLSLIHI